MKTYLAIPILAVFFAVGVGRLSSASTVHPAAKECADCGCSGPEKKGGCPDEKDKTCHCSKK